MIKPDGKIVFSFLEFMIPSHWSIFENHVRDKDPDKVHVQFLSRDAIEAWASHLELKIIDMHDGDKPHIKLNEVIRGEDGTEMSDLGMLGQSVCVLARQ